MKTTQSFFFQQADDMRGVKTESIGLVITSPPYPMIGMWDESFDSQTLNKEFSELTVSIIIYWILWTAGFYFLLVSVFDFVPIYYAFAFPLSTASFIT